MLHQMQIAPTYYGDSGNIEIGLCPLIRFTGMIGMPGHVLTIIGFQVRGFIEETSKSAAKTVGVYINIR